MKLRRRARGATMVEFVIIAPLLVLFSLTLIQVGLLLFAQGQMSYATLMAVRAGSTGNADPTLMEQAYVQAMVPWYGGGSDSASLAASYHRAQRDVDRHVLMQVISPTAASYKRWNDPELQTSEGKGRPVIPWDGTERRRAVAGDAGSQSIEQARVLKLRVMQSIQPIDPLITRWYIDLLRRVDPHDSSQAGRYYTEQLDQGRLVVDSSAAVQMQSDAIELATPAT